MNKPIFSFCYSNNPVNSNQDLDQVRSNATQRTSHYTYRSVTSTKVNFYRVDQIRPTKISFPNLPKTPANKPPNRKMPTEPNKMEQLEKPMLTFRAQQIQQKITKQNNGFFTWKGFGTFCGISQKQQSLTGCICVQPCKYMQEWTKSTKSSDHQVYLNLKKLKTAQANQIQIDKDINRTYPHNPTFSKNLKFRQMLREILITYSIYDAELGYIQGMNLITAILLYHIKSPEHTFWALVDLMEYRELRMIYVGNLEHLVSHGKRIDHLICTTLNSLYVHMLKLGVNSRCFLDGWILSLMSKIIPLEDMPSVLINFRKIGWNFIYQLILSFFKALKDCLLMAEEQPQFLLALSEQNCNELGIQWPKIIKDATNAKF